MDSSGSAPLSTERSPSAAGSHPDEQLRHGPKCSESADTSANTQLQHGPKCPVSTPANPSLRESKSKTSTKGKNTGKPSKKTEKRTSAVPKPSPSSDKGNEGKIKKFDTRLSKLESMLSQLIEQQTPKPVSVTAPIHTAPASARGEELELDYCDDYDYNQPGPGPSYPQSGNDDQHEVEFDNTDTSCHSEPGTSTDHEKVVPALAAKFAVQADVGPELHDEIATSTKFLMNNKLEEKVLDETAAKYLPPANCVTLDAPKVNQTIWDNLTATTRSRDLKLSRVQKSLTRGLTAFAQSLHPSTLSDKQQDALALLANANYEMNALRKELIKPEMNSAYNHLCKASTPVTKHLFGDDLGKRVKDMKDEQRAAVGVVNTRKDLGRGRFRTPSYHPYASREFSRSQYRAAGWTAPSNRPASGSRSKPFLDKAPYFKQRRPPPAQGQAPDRRAQPTPQTQGRYRSTTQHK